MSCQTTYILKHGLYNHDYYINNLKENIAKIQYFECYNIQLILPWLQSRTFQIQFLFSGMKLTKMISILLT